MNFKYLILILIILGGCKGIDSDSENTDSTVYIPLKIELSGDNGVVSSNGTITAPSSAFNRALSVSDCQTYGDVGTGELESIVADPGRCFTKLERIDSTGGFVKWVEDSSPDVQNGPSRIVSVTVEKCGIIRLDGSVWEVPEGKCPKKNGGFKNNKALERFSDTKMRGLSPDGYIEYDQSNDTATVIVAGNISQVHEVDHANKSQIIYKSGTSVMRFQDGTTDVIPELENKEYHQLGTSIQLKSGNTFKRCYFDDDGVPVQGSDSMAICNSHSEPVNFDYWLANGEDLNGLTAMPQGPVYHGSLSNCTSDETGNTTVMFCGDDIFKYTTKDKDLEKVDFCVLGNCGGSESVSCSTDNYYYMFTPFVDISTDAYSTFRLTQIDISNDSYSNLFNIDASGDMTSEQLANYHIQSISCGSDTVTGITGARTILINNADSTPDINYLDIGVEGVI